jgi:hypothetical protein
LVERPLDVLQMGHPMTKASFIVLLGKEYYHPGSSQGEYLRNQSYE